MHAVNCYPGTHPLKWPEAEHAAMADRLMDNAHRFVDRKMADAMVRRSRHWNRDFSEGRQVYEGSIARNREVLMTLIGVVEERSFEMEQFGNESNPALIAETDVYRVYQARWQSVEGVWCEGLLVKPLALPKGYSVVILDADQTPEQLMGLQLGIPPERRTARLLAERGFILAIPTLIDRRKVNPARMDQTSVKRPQG